MYFIKWLSRFLKRVKKGQYNTSIQFGVIGQIETYLEYSVGWKTFTQMCVASAELFVLEIGYTG